MTAKYEVQSGDTLWELAERFHGDGRLHRVIAVINHLADPDLIVVGQELEIPYVTFRYQVKAGDTKKKLALLVTAAAVLGIGRTTAAQICEATGIDMVESVVILVESVIIYDESVERGDHLTVRDSGGVDRGDGAVVDVQIAGAADGPSRG